MLHADMLWGGIFPIIKELIIEFENIVSSPQRVYFTHKFILNFNNDKTTTLDELKCKTLHVVNIVRMKLLT